MIYALYLIVVFLLGRVLYQLGLIIVYSVQDRWATRKNNINSSRR